ncbi:hypothetical protein AB0I69_07180 [Streptomyces sp. NPDC050508]|uniref:hypothetical protein n=1 Tax=Streptomyces sp. NPDC050508 TaxID=3155405 RepID=UPI003445AE2A
MPINTPVGNLDRVIPHTERLEPDREQSRPRPASRQAVSNDERNNYFTVNISSSEHPEIRVSATRP